MRAEKDGRAIAAETCEQIRGGIAPHASPASGEPVTDERPRALLLAGEAESRDGRALPADARQLGDPPLETSAIDHRRRSARSSGANVRCAKTSRSSSFAIGIARSISTAYFGFRSAVSRARSSSASTAWPPRRSAT